MKVKDGFYKLDIININIGGICKNDPQLGNVCNRSFTSIKYQFPSCSSQNVPYGVRL